MASVANLWKLKLMNSLNGLVNLNDAERILQIYRPYVDCFSLRLVDILLITVLK